MNGAAPEFTFGVTMDRNCTANTFNRPLFVAVDSKDNCWVSDETHHRVTKYKSCSTTMSDTASLVLGQTDLESCGSSGSSLSQVNAPAGLFVSSLDTLWVSDLGNNRVLSFLKVSSIFKNGAPAALQLGMGTQGCSANQLHAPFGLTGDMNDNLWVVDSYNNRVAIYQNVSTKMNLGSMDMVLGLTSLTKCPSPTFCTSSNLLTPQGISVANDGTLYVADAYHYRVLAWTNASTISSNGVEASFAIGQSNLKTCSAPKKTSSSSLNLPYGIQYDDYVSHTLVAADYNDNRALIYCSNDMFRDDVVQKEKIIIKIE